VRRAARFLALVFAVNQLLVLAASLAAHWGEWQGRSLGAFLHWWLVDNYRFWDAQWYVRIASLGYDLKRTAFFPLYPELMRFVSQALGMGSLAAGVLISHLAFVGLLVAFYALARLDLDERNARRIVWMLALYPTAFFFSAAYTEALFMLCSVLALYAMRTRRWALASGCSALAALTRNMGVFLVVPLVLEYLEAQGVVWRRVPTRDRLIRMALGAGAVAVLPVASLLGLMTYLWSRFGDPLSFVHVQPLYYRYASNPVSVIMIGYAQNLRRLVEPWLPNIHHHPWWIKLFYHPLETLVVTLTIVVLVAGFRRMRLSYWVVILYSLLIPLSTYTQGDNFGSFLRYSLVIAPLYLGVHRLLGERNGLRRTYFALSAAFLLLLTFVWSTGRWVA
jgi:hypothetical protein